MKLTREESYALFLEDKERGNKLFDKIVNASLAELAAYATSPDEEERWLAQWQLKVRKELTQ